MDFSVQAFKLPKRGNSEDEYEDAFEYSVESRRYAIADGATESAYADRWAQALVRQYVLDPPFGSPPTEDALQIWMLPLQMEWHSGINWSTLPWFALEKAESGAAAAFLGLEFSESNPTLWRRLLSKALPAEETPWIAFAVGDTCLFHVRGEELLQAFPLDKADQFNSRPTLLASVDKYNIPALKAIRSTTGTFRTNDLIILATDALSKWFLAEREAGKKPWETLLDVKNDGDFAALIDLLRTSAALKNDDTTMMILKCS